MNDPFKRLLLVEDNLADAGVLRTALSEVASTDFAFRLVHVEKLSEALRLLRDNSFDLILLDLSLRDVWGMEAVIRVKEAAPTIAVVVVTDVDDEDVALERVRIGAPPYGVNGQRDRRMQARALR